MSNNNGEELDELYLKYSPLIPLLNLASIFCLFMVSNDLNSAKFKGIFSVLIFLDLSDVQGTALHTCPFEDFWHQFLRHFYCLFSSSPPWFLYLFLLSWYLFSLFSFNMSLIITVFLVSSFFLHIFFCFH